MNSREFNAKILNQEREFSKMGAFWDSYVASHPEYRDIYNRAVKFLSKGAWAKLASDWITYFAEYSDSPLNESYWTSRYNDVKKEAANYGIPSTVFIGASSMPAANQDMAQFRRICNVELLKDGSNKFFLKATACLGGEKKSRMVALGPIMQSLAKAIRDYHDELHRTGQGGYIGVPYDVVGAVSRDHRTGSNTINRAFPKITKPKTPARPASSIPPNRTYNPTKTTIINNPTPAQQGQSYPGYDQYGNPIQQGYPGYDMYGNPIPSPYQDPYAAQGGYPAPYPPQYPPQYPTSYPDPSMYAQPYPAPYPDPSMYAQSMPYIDPSLYGANPYDPYAGMNPYMAPAVPAYVNPITGTAQEMTLEQLRQGDTGYRPFGATLQDMRNAALPPGVNPLMIQGWFDSISKVAKNIAEVSAVKALYEDVKDAAKNRTLQKVALSAVMGPEGGMIIDAAYRVHDTVVAAKKGDPDAIQKLQLLKMAADDGDQAAVKTVKTANVINQKLNQKEGIQSNVSGWLYNKPYRTTAETLTGTLKGEFPTVGIALREGWHDALDLVKNMNRKPLINLG